MKTRRVFCELGNTLFNVILMDFKISDG